MDKNIFEEMKGKTREERQAMLANKEDIALCLDELSAVNGGYAVGWDHPETMNPNSTECPYLGNWISSFGYICGGHQVC